MKVLHISAFSISPEKGGNAAGVVICDALPAESEMQRIAFEVGYSETVFATRQGETWRTRYLRRLERCHFADMQRLPLVPPWPIYMDRARFAYNSMIPKSWLRASMITEPYLQPLPRRAPKAARPQIRF